MHATLCEMITDLVQNSIEARASEIVLKVEETNSNLMVVIADDGKGMDEATLSKAKDPFYTDGRKHPDRNVGLGLPFLFQTAEMTGGTATIESVKDKGTTVTFTLDLGNLDVPDFGSFAMAAITLMTYEFDGNLKIERRVDGKEYEVSKAELSDVLDDMNNVESLALLKNFITSQEEAIGAI